MREKLLRQDTSANWTSNNPLLKSGEVGYETDTKKKKTGDGVNYWTALDYDASTAGDVRGTVLTGISFAANAVITAADTILTALGKLQKQISDHLANVSNPHAVTKSQVGLGSADNTPDADKPVSTAQATAIALKEDTANKASDFSVVNHVKFPSVQATKTYVDGLIDATLKPPEAFTPAGTYPVTYNGNAVQKGDTYRMGGAGAMGAVTVDSEDLLISLLDTPGQTDGNWQVVESNRVQATETVKGYAELATQAETNTGTDDARIVTPLKLATWWTAIKAAVITFGAQVTFTAAPKFSSVTASQILEVDGSKDLISAAKGTAYNKSFGTGTANIPEIGATLANSQAVQTDASGKLITSPAPAEADISTTILWTGTTPPSSLAAAKEWGYRVGPFFVGFMRLEYDVAGSALTTLSVIIPSTWPAPFGASEWDNSELGFPVQANLATAVGGTPVVSRGFVEKTGAGVIRFAVVAASGNYAFGMFSCTYITA